MPYVAQRALEAVRASDFAPVTYSPGDVITDFAAWPEVPKRANLALEWVRWVVEGPRVAVASEQLASVRPACPVCHRTFKGAVALKMHMTRTHPPQRD